MLLLIIFSFLAGIVTILSPCILPILPIVLSGSITGGKRRPIGVVVGFIFSFTFFTLFLTSIVKATGLSADVLRSVSVFIVAVFGISLLISQFQVFLERLFSILSGWVSQKVSQETNPKTKAGFISGLLIGVSLGLVWTPCVGPILASIITVAATSSVSFGAVLITLFYSLGTAIPMLAIIYGGRNLLQKAPWLVRNTGNIQKAFGILMIATAVSIYFNLDRKFQAYIVEIFPSYGVGLNKFQDIPAIKDALKNLESTKTDASLVLNFDAVSVYLVMRPRESSGKVRVYLDEKVVDEEFAGEDVDNGIVTVDTDRLYKLIKLSQGLRHLLRLEFLDDNVEVFAFTFG